MHNNSHPEYKETETDSAASVAVEPAMTARERLAAYIKTHPPVDNGDGTFRIFSNADAGRELGYSTSMVSKYLNDKLDGDTSAFESTVEDVLKTAAERRGEEQTLFPTHVTQLVRMTLERIRRTNDFGLVCGPAGVGKTSSLVLYQRDNPSSIVLTGTRWKRDAGGMQNLLFAAVETHGYDGFSPRMDYVSKKLRDSNRLVIVDNAHRLTIGALELLFDLHDEAGFGLALVGNEEVLDTIRQSDQLYSRIGTKQPVFVAAQDKKSEIKGAATFDQTVRRLVEIHAPGSNGSTDDLVDLGLVVAGQKGHFRALKKRLRLARDLSDAGMKWVPAFKAAHQQLIHDYELD